jgi:hypothetical protein
VLADNLQTQLRKFPPATGTDGRRGLKENQHQ